MRPRTTLFTLLVTFLAVPAAQAQAPADSASTPSVASSDTAWVGGPRMESARVGLTRNVALAPAMAAKTAESPLVQTTQQRGNSGRTMMLVGGLVFMGGLLIGNDVGTAIAVTGLAVGAYGFYQLIR